MVNLESITHFMLLVERGERGKGAVVAGCRVCIIWLLRFDVLHLQLLLLDQSLHIVLVTIVTLDSRDSLSWLSFDLLQAFLAWFEAVTACSQPGMTSRWFLIQFYSKFEQQVKRFYQILVLPNFGSFKFSQTFLFVLQILQR